jgi:hypothetical protein
MKHPETAALAKAAVESTKSKTVAEVLTLLQGSVGKRTFYDWLEGKIRAGTLAQMVLRQFANGWRPKK